MPAGGLGGGQPPGAKAVPESPSKAPRKARTVGLVALGCPKNLVDGEVMLGRLQGAGYQLVADARQADVIVVNTCAFIDRAKQESVDAIAHHLSLMSQQGEEMEVLGGISDQIADIGDELYSASDRDKLREWGNEIDAPGKAH